MDSEACISQKNDRNLAERDKNIDHVVQIKMVSDEKAGKLLQVIVEGKDKAEELGLSLEEVTKNRKDVYELLKTVIVEERELSILYTRLAFDILNLDGTNTSYSNMQYIRAFRAFTNLLIALGKNPEDYLRSTITTRMIDDWRNRVKSRDELFYEIGDRPDFDSDKNRGALGGEYLSNQARERTVFPLEKVFQNVQLVENRDRNGDVCAYIKFGFRISDAYSAQSLIDSLSDQEKFGAQKLPEMKEMANDIEIFLKTFMAYKTNGINDINLCALRVLSPDDYESVRRSLLRHGQEACDLVLRGSDKKKLIVELGEQKLDDILKDLGTHRFFVTGETGLVGNGLGTDHSLAPEALRFLRYRSDCITPRDYAEQWAWVLRVLAQDGYVTRRCIPEKNSWFENNGNTLVLGLHGWSGSGEVMQHEVLLRLGQIRQEKELFPEVNHDSTVLIGWSMGGEAVIHLARKVIEQRLEVLCNKAKVKRPNELDKDTLEEERAKRRIIVIPLMRASAGSCGFLHVTEAEAKMKPDIRAEFEELLKVLASRATVDSGQIAHGIKLTGTDLLKQIAILYAGLIMSKNDSLVKQIAETHATVFAREPESVALQKRGLITYKGLGKQEIDTLKFALRHLCYMFGVWDKDDFLTRMPDQEKNAQREALGVPYFVMHEGYGHAICDPDMVDLPVSAFCVWPSQNLDFMRQRINEIFEFLKNNNQLNNYADLPNALRVRIQHSLFRKIDNLNLEGGKAGLVQKKLESACIFALNHRVRVY
ncbi:MAG: hypothetical protein NZM26_01940 [Patescibacteria group bacterium]|nr:hypothetical protein [Patescibacteria group bacterium]